MTSPLIALNGSALDIGDVPVNWTLADVIRYRTPLRGVHLACEHGVCGTCTVLLDGRPVRACLVLAHAVGNRRVTTVEGLSGLDEAKADAVRRAFLEHNAFQCGYCTPGMMALGFFALGDGAGRGDVVRDDNGVGRRDGYAGSARDRARDVVAANICRCTGYSAIVTAVEQLLAARPSGEPVAER